MYTDIPVIKIAMNNGFASVAAFNKVFKEKMELIRWIFMSKICQM